MTDWSDEKLDAMRLVGDPRADEVVAELFRTHETADVSALFHGLTKDDAPVPDAMPAIVRAYFAETEALPDFADHALLERGEEVFAVHGVSIVSGLFCCALPHAYCAHRGARVLIETGRMVGDFTRRIVETAQFVMDVMAPGGLAPSGRGLRTTQKVRLIHAAIRRRQFGPSEDGRSLTRALLGAMESYVPGARFDGAGAVYVRHFLGDELADSLDVPPAYWTELVYRAETLIARVLDDVTERSPLVAHLFGGFDRALMEGLSVAYRGGKGVGFRIPDSLSDRWNLGSS
jgi:hypothetical protein